ncbi:hypothetical protein PENSPDRAFT_607411 [Peniophora sp. CONT]|nr:hypothetical protein PENSPDRAFT_607411 [Peniophora sp. CONT]
MKFSAVLSVAFAATVSAFPIEYRKLARRDAAPSADQIAQLAPALGFSAGVNPTGTGDCDGAVNGADGKPIKVPCQCPPDQATYIAALTADVQAGHAVNNPTVAVSFPTDDSTASQITRINAALVALQNLNGEGKGCPASSTTLSAQQKALASGQSASSATATTAAPAAPAASSAVVATSAAAPAASASAAAGTASEAQIAQLAPALGFSAGVNPTGTGDCDGAVNGADGKPIKVPCQCPPDQTTYINALTADVLAGHAVNNPTVAVSFPTDDSTQSQITRINAALVALQNLNGEGKGCPASSTTLSAQQKALQAQL